MIITSQALDRRRYWVSEIVRISGDFGQDVSRVEKEIADEVAVSGYYSLLDHLRLCGVIPESYEHDSSEEKLYSKYTDALLSVCFRSLGLRSLVLTERADAADVEAYADDYSLVADAKAFRLSRTAKNQKDFKIHALDGWRRGKSYALAVCPLYQLPSRTSQIYQQAIERNVCVLSYSHLAVIVGVGAQLGQESATNLLRSVLASVVLLNPTKDALVYWTNINRNFVDHDGAVKDLWHLEKQATGESIAAAKEEGLACLAGERESIMRMTQEEAVRRLIQVQKLESRAQKISTMGDNGLMSMGE